MSKTIDLTGLRKPSASHEYLSTGCLHGEHSYCQSWTGQSGLKTPGECKFCMAKCVCGCHQEAPDVAS
jgi:hypothetical protein